MASDDKSNILITVQGMDYLESNQPSAAVVMPYIKPTVVEEQDSPPNVLVAALNAALASRTAKN